ncbi:alanine--tRNA ligase [Gracilaria domingensis]|nr:alanine--tRNA ligase [Gracilaria domingensis]
MWLASRRSEFRGLVWKTTSGRRVLPGLADLVDDERFIELYNLVFMPYQRDDQGVLTPLAAKNIDSGMGLERMAHVLQQMYINYETGLIQPIIDVVADQTDIAYRSATEAEVTSFKVFVDHLRAVSHLAADNVSSSNVGRDYNVPRLLRRIVRHARLLGIEDAFIADVVLTVAQLAKEAGLGSTRIINPSPF